MSSSAERHGNGRSVAIIGFGYVGTVIGIFLAEKGFRVIGIDTNTSVIQKFLANQMPFKEPDVPESLAKFLKAGSIRVSSSYNPVHEADVIIITVGTPIGGDRSADLTAVSSCVNEVAKHLRPGQLIILKSTIPPGTTRNVVAPLLQKSGFKLGRDIYLSFCPERLAEGNAMNEVKTLPVVVGGLDSRSAELAERFWQSVDLKTIRVSSLEAAELTKLADNTWIDVNIALTNELARVCEALGVDVMEVIAAANSLPKGSGFVHYMVPGVGVGGSCLTKDPWFLVDFARSKGVQIKLPAIGRAVNDNVPGSIVEMISAAAKEKGHAPSGSKVALLGYAFKGSTSDTRDTPAREIAKQFIGRGFQVLVYDPLVEPKVIRTETRARVAASIRDCLHGADVLVLAANHPQFRLITEPELRSMSPKCIVYDGSHSLDAKLVLRCGFDYYSPGYFAKK